MNTETIIKRENGTQYKISVNLYINYSDKAKWTVSIVTREKGKRKWHHLQDTLSDYQFRELSMENQRAHIQENYLRFITKEELLNVKIKLWESIKPTLS